MTPTLAHIINHTHWDREWFLTSIYTSRWIPPLIDRLEQRAASNPQFTYLFDGQTLVIEDLCQVSVEHAEKAARLVREGRLVIGPYYCQPDWQLTTGELLIRNLLYGQQDVARYGGQTDTGWLVDTFGHISQSPQIHQMFGIKGVYVWRGVPELEPYFWWQGADGARLFTIYLLGGYRNLYGVTHAPEVAVRRLHAEVDKLAAFYPTGDIPLFDGYDLEDNPEDPVAFYSGQEGVRPDISVLESTPARFAEGMLAKDLPLPEIASELNSGKYGAVFPGTLSTRDYLKVMAADCARLLHKVCEPLAVMAYLQGKGYNASLYESWGRQLLQNAVHDGICGVSIDQVHEKMEYIYRQVFDGMLADTQGCLESIISGFQPGEYAVSTIPFRCEAWLPVRDRLYHVKTGGVGVYPVEEILPVETVNEVVESFAWHNEHYSAVVGPDGRVSAGEGGYGALSVSREHGDTYSDELGELLGSMAVVSPLVVLERSARHCVIGFDCRWESDAGEWAAAQVRLVFDPTPTIGWQIDLDSRGADLRVEMAFETHVSGECCAGMQFDTLSRPSQDRDLLPRQVPEELSAILLGQRELEAVRTFPFHDVLSLTDGERSAAVFAAGIHAYSAGGDGTLKLTLRRSVEQLTRPDLLYRLGDAGPFFYVPDARCERSVSHRLGLVLGRPASPTGLELQALLAAFQTPPLLVQGQGPGQEKSWQLLQEDMPLSSLSIQGEQILARFYNPTPQAHHFSRPYQQTDVWGQPQSSIEEISPKKIVTVQLEGGKVGDRAQGSEMALLNPPTWRVGANQGRPDPRWCDLLEEKIRVLEKETAAVWTQLEKAAGSQALTLQHRYYVLQRECTEYKFSLLLNQRKLAEQEPLRYEYLFEPDEEVAVLGLELNQLRMKRRIFDYIVAMLG